MYNFHHYLEILHKRYSKRQINRVTYKRLTFRLILWDTRNSELEKAKKSQSWEDYEWDGWDD